MCSHHLGTRALVQKAFRQGFYWPSAVADAHDIVRQCPECQRHAPYSKFASNEIQLIPPVWPFTQWGMYIVGPLPTAPGNYTHAVVAVEYFSKWVEAKPLLSITSATIQKFFWQNIVCRFGVPYEVTVNNGTYLSGHKVMLRFGLPPAIQWGGRTGKWGNIHQYKKEHHRPAQKQMGRRAVEGDLVPQHHNLQNHAVLAVQVALWRRSHVT
jgi:hypothetical protein